jgi:integrase/recombinase XerD
MPGKARTLTPAELDRVLDHIRPRKDYLRLRAMILFGFLCGMRAKEMALIEWRHISDDSGKIGQSVNIENSISKGGRGRIVPMHPKMRTALIALRRRTPSPVGPIFKSRKSGSAIRPNSVVNILKSVYVGAGFTSKVSSHSGRRSYGTQLSRHLVEANASIFEIRDLMGHSSIDTTTLYVDPSDGAKRRLVNLL